MKDDYFDIFSSYKFKGKVYSIEFKIPFYYGKIDGEMEIYYDSILLAKFIFKNGNLIEKIYY